LRGGIGAVAFWIPRIARIGRRRDPAATQGVQEAAVTEHGILFRTTEDRQARARDFTEAQREWGARRA
jgi:hypothetical protein